MRFALICGAAVMAVSGCVVQTVPGTSPPSGTAQPAPPSGPTLQSGIAGRAFFNDQFPGQQLNLWSDGSYTLTRFGEQSFGNWSTNEAAVQVCFTGPMTSYTNTACSPVRWDGDALTLFDGSRTVALVTWIPT